MYKCKLVLIYTLFIHSLYTLYTLFIHYLSALYTFFTHSFYTLLRTFFLTLALLFQRPSFCISCKHFYICFFMVYAHYCLSISEVFQTVASFFLDISFTPTWHQVFLEVWVTDISLPGYLILDQKQNFHTLTWHIFFQITAFK